ncbi:MAG: winged helix-turn-helix domain-containing protein [Bdellovibrionaceae bacterium]|nr:winged helix-turn-helix domain-containing protein [Pseudobdellovibrionaceae bacterium]
MLDSSRLSLDETLNSKKWAELLAREARHCFERAAFREAMEHFTRAAELYLSLGETASWIEVTTQMLRIYVEWSDESAIARLEKRLIESLNTAEFSKSLESRAHYIIGLCHSCRRETVPQAIMHFRISMDRAVDANDQRALSYPILGLANLHFAANQLAEAAKELEKLELILAYVDVPDIRGAALILRALILRNQGRHNEALVYLRDAIVHLREHHNTFLYIHALHAHWSVYFQKGDRESARHYLDLAAMTVNERELPRLKRLIDSALESQRSPNVNTPYNFRLDKSNDVILDHKNRAIRLRGRFVLRDLAFLLMSEPGRVFSKEDITNTVWNEKYDPDVHDNKIYVTIKRLRSLLESSDENRSEPYVLRYKIGYCFDPNAKVQVI